MVEVPLSMELLEGKFNEGDTIIVKKKTKRLKLLL